MTNIINLKPVRVVPLKKGDDSRRNMNGRPAGQSLRTLLASKHKDDIIEIVASQIEKAKNGDEKAIDRIWYAFIGKAPADSTADYSEIEQKDCGIPKDILNKMREDFVNALNTYGGIVENE